MIKELMADLVPQGSPMVDYGEWVTTLCPLALWTHQSGQDTKPSFGVKVNDHNISVAHCFTCKFKGTLPMMLERIAEYSGEDYEGLITDTEQEEYIGREMPEWGSRPRDSKHEGLGEPADSMTLDIYDEAEGHWYLEKRGVSDRVAKELDLRVDPGSPGEERILFPVYSYDGGFYGYTGRSVEDDSSLRVKDYFGLKKRHLLLGAEFIDPKTDRFILVAEGLFDFAKVFSYGMPVVAAMHSGITDQQADVLKDIGLPVYSLQDNDQAGREGTAKIAKLLQGHVPVMDMTYPRRMVYDPKKKRKRQVGDPAELRKAEIEYMIANADFAVCS